MENKEKIKLVKEELLPEIEVIEGMPRKEYLEYYVKVLEENIKEAKKILEEKKEELKGLK